MHHHSHALRFFPYIEKNDLEPHSDRINSPGGDWQLKLLHCSPITKLFVVDHTVQLQEVACNR